MAETIRSKQEKTGEGVMQVECMAVVQMMDCKKNELHRGNITSDEGRIIS